MAFFKLARDSPLPSVSAHTPPSKYENVLTETFADNSLYTNNSVNSPPPLQSSSLESSSSNQFELEPELPRNMYMPSVTASPTKDCNDIDSNRIYILGSHNDNQCWLYDPTYKTYEKLCHFPKKIVPKGHCIARFNNITFSMGGSTSSKHFLFFNTATQQWHTGAMTRGKDFGIGAKAITINNTELHVVGGDKKANKYFIYNRTSKQWREGPKLPIKLIHHGMVFVAENNLKTNQKAVKTYLKDHKPQLIVFGGCQIKTGWGSSTAPSTKMYRFYIADNYRQDWKHIGDLPVAIQNFAFLCVLNNYILIFGGELAESKYSRNIYMYNISTKIWKLSGIKLPTHLYGLSAIETSNGVIHIFGGHDGKTSQRLHYSIKTSKLLQKEFDEFDTSFTWKQLSRSGYSDDINDDISLLDELKRVKRKLKDIEENYTVTQCQYKHIYEENQQIKSTNISLLDKLAQVMQAKEEIMYELQEMERAKPHKSRSKSFITSHQQILKTRSLSETPLTENTNRNINRNNKNINRNRNRNKKRRHKNRRKMTYNPYDEKRLRNELKTKKGNNRDPKYIMFRNFLFGRIGLHQYLSEFEASNYSDICKLQCLTDIDLKFKVGISNELHRKLILKTINEFKLEILQFKSWIMSYDEKPNLVQYIKPLAKYGIITWHLLAQHIQSKDDFKYKLFIDNDDAVDCLYEHLIEFLNGSIPAPNPNGIRGNELEYKHDHFIDDNDVLFVDDSGYHNW